MFAWQSLERNACKTEGFPEWYFISEMQFLAFYYSVGDI